MPIQHVVLIKLKPVVEGEADLATMQAEVQALLQSVPHGSSLVMGPPLFAEKAGGYDFGLTRVFKDVEDFKGYMAHPDHIKVLGILGPRVEAMVSVQLDAPGLTV